MAPGLMRAETSQCFAKINECYKIRYFYTVTSRYGFYLPVHGTDLFLSMFQFFSFNEGKIFLAFRVF